MALILKYKKEILLALGLVVLYLATRLVLISNFPIFTDEALYVRWTQIAAQDANWRFISLTDGKQPLFIWAAIPFVKLMQDPLLAVRLVSVICGLFSVVGLFLLTRELFKNKLASYLSALLYIVYPFAIVYDRLALYDSMVTAFAIWSVYFSILLVRKIRLDVAYTLGFVLAGGLLTKSSAIFSVYLLPFTLLLFDFKNKAWKKNLLKWVIFASFAALIAEGFYNFLRFSPFFHIISEKNTIFVYPFSEWLKHPLTFFVGNLNGLVGWLFTYLTPFYFILVLMSFTSLKFIKEKLLLILYFLLPFVALALFGKVIFPRFIFFMSVYLLPLAAVGMAYVIAFLHNFLKKRKIDSFYAVIIIVAVLFLIYPAKVTLDFIFNPQAAAIADADKRQYITEWPAGGGLWESVEFFENEARNGKIFVATEGTFGLLPYGLDIYLADNANIVTKGYWPIEDKMPDEVLEKAKEVPTYFIFYQPCGSCDFAGDAPNTWPLELIKSIKKSDNVYYSIYKVEG